MTPGGRLAIGGGAEPGALAGGLDPPDAGLDARADSVDGAGALGRALRVVDAGAGAPRTGGGGGGAIVTGAAGCGGGDGGAAPTAGAGRGSGGGAP